ncbi:hypothetical protein [Aliivibrio fischeri]|uniref:hypothetical protein n=1 Tax=Aliivibrio fischeri TaxID=668 RepID=UPI00166DA28D|nr:hypothetical protein [Aliivibrio fischeri]USR96736.1 hypothetical protein AVFI_06685 [Aliivibrio fischeri ATCC 7744 = JCM 18803 = DSM 507]USR97224.1 hypothetical protein AVFI_18755 [Aliivibrio fischeri ATCC 7744 = JCM 18803 = DSM 507]GGK51314.1 hypothetical protein GCM10007987_37880 [Aliivibrio fischeri]
MRKLLLSLFLIVPFTYASYGTIEPLLLPIEQVNKVLFSSFAMPLIATWGITIFGFISLLMSVKSLITKNEYKSAMKSFYISLLLGFIVGISVNYANYYLVIKPNNMIECPKKIGYKKNLMRDYVKDISQCEKF